MSGWRVAEIGGGYGGQARGGSGRSWRVLLRLCGDLPAHHACLPISLACPPRLPTTPACPPRPPTMPAPPHPHHACLAPSPAGQDPAGPRRPQPLCDLGPPRGQPAAAALPRPRAQRIGRDNELPLRARGRRQLAVSPAPAAQPRTPLAFCRAFSHMCSDRTSLSRLPCGCLCTTRVPSRPPSGCAAHLISSSRTTLSASCPSETSCHTPRTSSGLRSMPS